MQRNILFGILLSSAVCNHAQDSLSIRKPVTDTLSQSANKPMAENNIKYIHFQKSKYAINNNLQDIKIAPESQTTLNAYTANELTSNWFINASGGVSAFLGDPLGCEDLFGRTRPMLHLSIGKWFSPTAGGRISFQGLNLKNHMIEQQNYYHLHADFLWNVTNLFMKDKPEARWQFIPFAGTGIIQNKATHQHPFTLNYGILNHLRLTDRIFISLEVGGLTTFGNFDGIGKANRFSDHLFHLSAGFSITLFNKGWNYQKNNINDLLTLNYSLSEANKQLKKENGQNNMVIAQMKKILEIEGLLSRIQSELEKSGLKLPQDTISENDLFYFPKNDYSGLNSLRKRLLTGTQDPNGNNQDRPGWPTTNSNTPITVQDSLSSDLPSNTSQSNLDYINYMINQKTCIGSPILFFFQIGTTTLTDSSQLANIDEIARICKKYDLLLKVTGFADSATGDVIGNSKLSNQRAHYIASELNKRNIAGKTIKLEGKGGVDDYSPEKVNRCVKIELYLKR